MRQLYRMAKETEILDALVFTGLPFQFRNRLYNAAAVLHRGKILGIIPKRNIPNYSEFYEARHFTEGPKEPEFVEGKQEQVPFGSRILFECEEMNGLSVAAEICEDVWVASPPSRGV